MGLDTIQEFRRERLKAAADKVGGNAALGRLLGHQDGAFVGQMIRGTRPISEKTVIELEAKHGFRHWFSEDPPVEGDDDMPLDPVRRRVVELMGELPLDEQERILAEVHERAARALGDKMLAEKFGVKGYAPDEKVGRTIKAAPRSKGSADG